MQPGLPPISPAAELPPLPALFPPATKGQSAHGQSSERLQTSPGGERRAWAGEPRLRLLAQACTLSSPSLSLPPGSECGEGRPRVQSSPTKELLVGPPSARSPPAPVRTLTALRAQLPPPDFRLPGGGDVRRSTRAPRHSWRAAGRRRCCPVPLGRPTPVAPPRASTGDASPLPSPAARPPAR